MESRGQAIANDVVLAGGAILIVATTLSPFTFQFHHLTWNDYVTGFNLTSSSLLDFPINVLLFTPFGFGLAALLDRRGIKPDARLLVTLLTGFLATVSIESLQMFLPKRTANVSDILANTMGTVVGLGCFQAWRNRQDLLRFFGAILVLRNIAVLFLAYFLLMLLMVWALMRGMSPDGWDANHGLALGGNDDAETRPWEGSVRDLMVLDRAVTPEVAAEILSGEMPTVLRDAVVAAYPLSGEAGLADRTGKLPDLVAQVNELPELGPHGVALRSGLWLATKGAVAPIADRINSSGQFTIAFTVSSFDLTQEGPARIVTNSPDAFHRNLTLGQSRTRLSLRWRSLLTGENGTTPELEFPGVFGSSGPRRVVVSYDGSTASCYIAGEATPLRVFLGPEVGFGAILREGHEWPIEVGPFAFWQSKLLISTIMFLPLGVLLGTAVGLAHRQTDRMSLIGGGLFLPAPLLEGFVTGYGHGELRLGMIALGVGVTSMGLAAAQWWRHRCSHGVVPTGPGRVDRLAARVPSQHGRESEVHRVLRGE